MGVGAKGELVEATFDLVTPLFCAGGDQGRAALRPPSLAGALAFWWRALAWARIPPRRQGCACRASWWRALAWARIPPDCADDRSRLAWLKREERALFGSAEDGQGQFLIQRLMLANGESKTSNNSRPGGFGDFSRQQENRPELSWRESGSGVRYLVGQGLSGRGVIVANGGGAPAQLTLTLLIKPAAAEAQRQELIDALVALGLMGGFGARSRRGFGSLALRRLVRRPLGAPPDSGETLFAPADSVQPLRELIEGILERCRSAARPPYSALSVDTRCDVVDLPGYNAAQAINWIGHHYQLYRGWGRNAGSGHTIGGEPALHARPGEIYPFRAEHDWFKESIEKSIKGEGVADRDENEPSRTQFGLPLPFSKTIGRGPGCETHKLLLKPKGFDRRASPLLMHVHRFAETHHAIVLTLLDSVFLPGSSPQLVATMRNSDKIVPAPANLEQVRSFMDWVVRQAPAAQTPEGQAP